MVVDFHDQTDEAVVPRLQTSFDARVIADDSEASDALEAAEEACYPCGEVEEVVPGCRAVEDYCKIVEVQARGVEGRRPPFEELAEVPAVGDEGYRAEGGQVVDWEQGEAVRNGCEEVGDEVGGCGQGEGLAVEVQLAADEEQWEVSEVGVGFVEGEAGGVGVVVEARVEGRALEGVFENGEAELGGEREEGTGRSVS